MILGNSGPYEEFKTPIEAFLTIFYILGTLLLVVIMLNLLIAIVGDTNQRVSSENELIYEQNRVLIIEDYLLQPEKKKKIKEILEQKGKYLINIYRKKSSIEEQNSIQSDTNQINERIEKIENNLEILGVCFEFLKIYIFFRIQTNKCCHY